MTATNRRKERANEINFRIMVGFFLIEHGLAIGFAIGYFI